MELKVFKVAILGLWISGCASLNQRSSQPQQQERLQIPARAIWETRLNIEDKKNNKPHRVLVDIIAVDNGPVRVEATGPLGVRLASLVARSGQFQALIYSQKKYYSGRDTTENIARYFNFPLSISEIQAIAMERDPGTNWNCVREVQSGFFKSCIHKKAPVKIEFRDRKGLAKTILVYHPDFEVQWEFSSPRPKSDLKDDIFVLKPLDGFQQILIK